MQWACCIALETKEIKQLPIFPSLLRTLPLTGLMKAEGPQVLISTVTVHQQQCHINQDSMLLTHKLSHQLDHQRAITRNCSPFNSPT